MQKVLLIYTLYRKLNERIERWNRNTHIYPQTPTEGITICNRRTIKINSVIKQRHRQRDGRVYRRTSLPRR